MSASLLPALWGTLQVATLPDTIITRTITERGWLETLVSIEQAVVGLAMLGMLLTIVLVLMAIRKSMQELSRLIQTSIGDISGTAHSIRSVAEDVRGVSKSLRSDFDAVSETVRDVNERVRDAVDGAEERVRRLGELVDTVQGEAEDLVESAAGTLQGVRAGAKAIRHGFSFARWATAKNVRRRGPVDADDDEPADEERPVRRRPRYRPRVRPRPRGE
jgi:uncharacterized protein YoxC